MGPALGARDGMHFIDDDGVHFAERFPGTGGQHEEQGLRRGDEDIGWVRQQRAAICRRRIS